MALNDAGDRDRRLGAGQTQRLQASGASDASGVGSRRFHGGRGVREGGPGRPEVREPARAAIGSPQ